jgi:hypothetical protein
VQGFQDVSYLLVLRYFAVSFVVALYVESARIAVPVVVRIGNVPSSLHRHYTRSTTRERQSCSRGIKDTPIQAIDLLKKELPQRTKRWSLNFDDEGVPLPDEVLDLRNDLNSPETKITSMRRLLQTYAVFSCSLSVGS